MNSQQNARTFYIILLTQLFSWIGSQMSSVAVGIWVYQETGNVAPLALVGVFATLPVIVVAGVAGVVSDRWDRRYVMALSDTGQGLATLALFAAFATDSFQLWHLYSVAFAQALFGIFQAPAFMASITMLIPDKHRPRANALQQLAGYTSGVAGPVLAGALYAFIGVMGVILIDLITFVAAVGVMLIVHIPHPAASAEGSAHRESIWQQYTTGFHFLRSKGPLFVFTILATLINFPIRVLLILITPYIIARTDSEALVGTLLGVMSVGGIVGGLILSVWGGFQRRMYTVMVGSIMFSVFTVVYGMSRSPLALGLALFFLALPFPFIDASFFAILQVKIHADLQGRVFAIILQAVTLLRPVAFITAGLLADNVFEPAVGKVGWEAVGGLVGNEAGAGMGLLIALSGLMALALTLTFLALPAIRNLEILLPDYPSEAPPAQEAVVEEAVALPTPAALESVSI